MSNEATVKLSLDGRDYESGVNRAKAGMKALSTTAQEESSKAQRAIERASAMDAKIASRSNARMANISAQIQDIAVQSQMGANIGTIISQQGGQLISALGGSGKLAVFAGVATVAAAVVSLGVAGNEAFAKLISGAAAFGKEMRNITAGGTKDQIVDSIGKSADMMKSLIAETQKFKGGNWTSLSGLGETAKAGLQYSWASARMGLGGEGPQGEIIKSYEQAVKLHKDITAAQKEAIALGWQEVEIARMKARGNDAAADAAKRELELKRTLAKISQNEAIGGGLKFELMIQAVAEYAAKAEGIENKKVDDILDHERNQKNEFIAFQKKQDEELLDFERKQKFDFIDHEKKLKEEAAKEDIFFANLEFQAMTEFYNEEERRINKARDLKVSGEKRSADALADAQDNLNDAQEKRMSISDQITLASGRLLQSEKMVAQTQKFGTKEAQDAAQAKMIQARGTLQELSLRRASQFVGKSSADIRRSERDAAKDQKELEKAGRRLIEADIRKADAANRRAGGLGLNDAQKAAMREAGNKALGQDLKQGAAEKAAESLGNIEKDMKEMKQKLGVAK